MENHSYQSVVDILTTDITKYLLYESMKDIPYFIHISTPFI